MFVNQYHKKELIGKGRSVLLQLESCVEGAVNDIELLFAGELDEVYCIAQNADCQLWVKL